MNNHASRRFTLSRCRRRSLVALAMAAGAAGALAVPASLAVAQQRQQPAGTPSSADSVTSAARTELQARAAALDAAGKHAEAAEVRRRLTEGDFAVGDRIAITITGSLAFSDTLPVRAGQLITIPSLPDISMRGVLRPELNDYLTRQVSRFVRDPIVHSASLVRVSVLGAVGRPGFYAMPADILLGDAIMRAGGPSGDADMGRTVVKRGNSEILSRGAVQGAVRSGATLAQLDVRAGDEIVVGKKRNYTQAIFLATGLVSAIVGVVVLLNNR